MSTIRWSYILLLLLVLVCLTLEIHGARVVTLTRSLKRRPKTGLNGIASLLLATQPVVRPRFKIKTPSVFIPDKQQPLIDRLLDNAVVVEERPASLPTTYDPVGALEARMEEDKKNQYRLNVGSAIDSLNTDMPNILRVEPNWDIFSEDLELDLQAADPVAFRLIGGVAGLAGRKAKGLQANQQALDRLQRFRRFWVQRDDIRIKMRASTYSLTRSENGDDVVEVRWNAKLLMKPDIELIPKWASSGIKFFQKHVLNSEHVEDTPQRDFIVDGVSKFHFNSEGKIYRHVVSDLELLPPLNMLEVDDILWMIGVPSQAPALALDR